MTIDLLLIISQIPEINSVLDDLEAAGVLEKPLIGGPTICCQWYVCDISLAIISLTKLNYDRSLDEVIKAGINEKKHYKYYT